MSPDREETAPTPLGRHVQADTHRRDRQRPRRHHRRRTHIVMTFVISRANRARMRESAQMNATVEEPVRRGLVRADPREARVSPLELFFDLVFVFALTQVTAFLAEDPTFAQL